jgi:hypothetical protein
MHPMWHITYCTQLLKIDYNTGYSNPNIGVSYKYLIRHSITLCHSLPYTEIFVKERGAGLINTVVSLDVGARREITKSCPTTRHEGVKGWREEVQLLLILDLGSRWRWVVSVTPRPRFTPGERTPGTHCTGGWVGPRAGLDTEARGKILSSLPGIEPRSPEINCYPCRKSKPCRPGWWWWWW